MKKLVMLCEILGITEEMLLKVVKGEAKLTYIEDIQGVKNAVHKVTGFSAVATPEPTLAEKDKSWSQKMAEDTVEGLAPHYSDGYKPSELPELPDIGVEKWSEVISSKNHVEEVSEVSKEVRKEEYNLPSTETENKVDNIDWIPQKFNLETKKFEGWGEIKDTSNHGSEDVTDVIPELMDDKNEDKSETTDQPITEVVTETNVASTQSVFWGTTPKTAEVDEHSPKEVSSVSSNPWMSNTWETVK